MGTITRAQWLQPLLPCSSPGSHAQTF